MEDFADYVVKEMNNRGWDQSELSRRSGITTSQLSRVINRESRPGLDFCKRLAKAYGLRDVDVMRIAGLIDSDADSKEFTAPIRNTIRYMQDMDEKDQADVEALVNALRTRRLRDVNSRKAHGAQKP